MDWKPYEHNVKYYETDQMAIVHHSNYIRWFEEARVDWLEQVGLPYDEMERRGIIIPVLSVSAEYKTMTRFGETVRILPRLEKYNGVRMEVSYTVVNAGSGEVRCVGRSGHCFLNRDYKPLILKNTAPDYHAVFQQVYAACHREE